MFYHSHSILAIGSNIPLIFLYVSISWHLHFWHFREAGTFWYICGTFCILMILSFFFLRFITRQLVWDSILCHLLSGILKYKGFTLQLKTKNSIYRWRKQIIEKHVFFFLLWLIVSLIDSDNEEILSISLEK